MSKTKLAVWGTVLFAAMLAGYLPEHAARMRAESESVALRQRVDAAESRNRLAGLLGDALLVQDLLVQADYGQAQQASSRFFDAVRRETQMTHAADAATSLTAVLQQRDTVTAALAKADLSVNEALKSVAKQLRTALDLPVVEGAPGPKGAHPPRTP